MSTQQIIESWESGVEPYNATTKPEKPCQTCKTLTPIIYDNGNCWTCNQQYPNCGVLP